MHNKSMEFSKSFKRDPWNQNFISNELAAPKIIQRSISRSSVERRPWQAPRPSTSCNNAQKVRNPVKLNPKKTDSAKRVQRNSKVNITADSIPKMANMNNSRKHEPSNTEVSFTGLKLSTINKRMNQKSQEQKTALNNSKIMEKN